MGELLGMLDSLGDDVQAVAPRHVDDRLRHSRGGLALADLVDQRLVDLQAIQPAEASELGERGLADAEVVDRQPDPQPLEAVEGDVGDRAVDDRGLGRLRLQHSAFEVIVA